MEKTAIIIRDKEQNLEVKKLMDKGGLRWHGGDPLLIDRDDTKKGSFHYLRHNFWDDGGITYAGLYGKTVYSALCYAKEEDYTIITADEFLANPKLLESWKEPEPEIKYCQYCGTELANKPNY